MTGRGISPRIDELHDSVKLFQGVYAACKLNLADLLTDGGKSLDYLAQKTEANREFLGRLLQFLSVHDIFIEVDETSYAQSPVSEQLTKGHPSSIHSQFLFLGAESCWGPWGKLYDAVKNGKSGYYQYFEEEVFDHLNAHPLEQEAFCDAMPNQRESQSTSFAKTLVAKYDFSNIKSMVDVGGGLGGFLTAVMREVPHLEGTLFDLPHPIKIAQENKYQPDLDSRLSFEAGSFFDHVPAGRKLYFLSRIIHDWSDTDSIKILKNCAKGMSSDSILLLAENLQELGHDPYRTMDLDMLVMSTGGKERTEADFISLLEKAGLQHERSIFTDAFSVIEARRVVST